MKGLSKNNNKTPKTDIDKFGDCQRERMGEVEEGEGGKW